LCCLLFAATNLTMTDFRLKRREASVLTLVCIAYLASDTLLSFSPFQEDSNNEQRGLLAYEDCNVDFTREPTEPIVPVFAASYPGSGSQMTHYLFEGLTGIPAADDWTVKGDDYNRIAIKTHYPAREHQVEGAGLMDRVILQLRNPLYSLPSHANYMYEHNNGLPDHTVRAPLSFWYDWRNNNFKNEIGLWRKHLEYWVDNYSALEGKRIVVSYERLTDHKMGPIETSRIAAFLGRSKGMKTVSPEIVPCVWDKIVNYNHGRRMKELKEVRRKNRIRRAQGLDDSSEYVHGDAKNNFLNHQMDFGGLDMDHGRKAHRMFTEEATAENFQNPLMMGGLTQGDLTIDHDHRRAKMLERTSEYIHGNAEDNLLDHQMDFGGVDLDHGRKAHRLFTEDATAENFQNPLMMGGLTKGDIEMKGEPEFDHGQRRIHRLVEKDAAENFQNPLVLGGLTQGEVGINDEESMINQGHRKIHRVRDEEAVENFQNPLVLGGLTQGEVGINDEESMINQGHRKIHRVRDEEAAENFQNPLVQGGLTEGDIGLQQGPEFNQGHRNVRETDDGAHRRTIEAKKKQQAKKKQEQRELNEDPAHPVQSLRSGPKVEYKFTEEELIEMLNMLYELRDKYIRKSDEFTLVVILDSYIVSVEDKLREVEDSKSTRVGSYYSSSLV